ncbi:PIN domain-containing protein [Acinetobacter harbinensis]|uniref:PIN domain-containing protein n=1 Tax=Acinetobacter harbinensis TaxID=1353941 RepID=UPI001C4FB29E|nr:PIN domain-containing protein [Acinetobacter harbinensis]
MKKILLLDIENSHKTENELFQLLTSYAFVYLVYAKSPMTLSLDGLQNLADFISKKKLVLIKMPKTGPDAADFGLAFLAGQLSIQMGKIDTEFDVMSNDKKFEYIVDLLKIMGFKAQQVKRKNVSNNENKLDVINSDLQKPEYKHLLTALQLLLKNQPKQFNSLNNALKSWMKNSDVNINKIIELLKKHQFIQIENQNISYELARMKQVLSVQANATIKTLVVQLPTVEEIQQKPHLQRIKQYCDYLIKIQKGRPAKVESLMNSIQSILRLDREPFPQDFLNILIKQKIVFKLDNQVTYNDLLIKAWSNIDILCLVKSENVINVLESPNSEITS